jgi:histidinol-phosphate aminotransferase
VNRNDYEAGIELVATTGNTVMTRTFSKIYGLANARVGWSYCPADVAGVLNRIRGPFNLTGPSMAAAIAGLADRSHIDRAKAHNNKWCPWLAGEIRALGLEVTESAANFVLVHFGAEPGKTALDADAFLQMHRIIVRRMESYNLPNALRITVGLEADNRALVAALSKFAGRS